MVGGCLNVIIPGLGYAYVGNWKQAIGTFFGVFGVFIFAVIMAMNIAVELLFVAIIGITIFLFVKGRKAVEDENRGLGREMD